MWIISKTRLREFWESPGMGDAELPLKAWFTVVSKARWQTWAELRDTYGNASLVGDCVVFNIAGNKYRLVTRIRFLAHKVFTLRIMTHEEYDGQKWKTDCGCYSAEAEAVAKQPKAGHSEREPAPVRKKKGGGR